jgi:hypothetical protein
MNVVAERMLGSSRGDRKLSGKASCKVRYMKAREIFA